MFEDDDDVEMFGFDDDDDDDSGFGSQGNGFGNQGNGFGNQGNGFGNQGNGFGNQGNGFGNQGNGFGNQGNGFGNQSSSGFGNSDMDADDDLDDFDDVPIQADTHGEKMEAAKAKDFKKTAVMLIGIGLFVLIVAVLGLRVVKSAKSEKSSSSSSTTTQAQTTVKNKSSNSGSSQKVNNNNVSSNTSTANSWQEVNLDGLDLGSTWIDSVFTVTDIKHYAMVSNDSNDKQVKSVVKGNISGLVGTYEMEIPTYMALKVSLGTSFKVSYQIKEQNGYKIIGEIKY
jgi:predicted negative regulator of RcsB-dependent stress response